MGAKGRTPHPIPKARNTWRRTEMPCWMTRLWQLETLHRHISLHSNIIGGSRKSKPSFKRPWRSYQDLTLKSEQLQVSSVEQLSEHLQCWKEKRWNSDYQLRIFPANPQLWSKNKTKTRALIGPWWIYAVKPVKPSKQKNFITTDFLPVR